MWRRMSLFFAKIYLIIFRRQIQCTWHTSKCEGLMWRRLKGRTSCYDEVELVCVKGNRVPVGMPEMSRWYLPICSKSINVSGNQSAGPYSHGRIMQPVSHTQISTCLQYQTYLIKTCPLKQLAHIEVRLRWNRQNMHHIFLLRNRENTIVFLLLFQ